MADKFGSFKLAEVFVRPVSIAEGQRLQRIGREARDPVRSRLAIMAEMLPELVGALHGEPVAGRVFLRRLEADEQRGGGVGACLEVLLHRLARLLGDDRGALAIAFADH